MSNQDIKDCTFTGIKYDAEMVSAVISIAGALECNAEALKELARAVNPENANIGPMINIKD